MSKIPQKSQEEQDKINEAVLNKKIQEILIESEMYSKPQDSKEDRFQEINKAEIEGFNSQLADNSYIFIELDRM
jgi:hypothetical protein